MATPVHPVQTLRDHASALEAAMTVALAEPGKGEVHRLRAQIRRLDAQMALLQQLDVLPPDAPEAKAVARRVRRLRRSAGKLRDLDVQSEMLETQSSLPAEAAATLREQLLQRRERKAGKLRKALEKNLPKIAESLEALVQSVATANGVVVPELRLVALIEKWKAAQDAALEPIPQPDDEQLHDARKTAKAARYMAESLSGSKRAKLAAAGYEALQDAGGRWHDWLDLAGTAEKFLGKKDPLTKVAREHCRQARAEYLKLLQ